MHLKAAGRRRVDEQAASATASFIGTNASRRELDRYIDSLTGGDQTLPAEALAGALRSASAGMATITRAEYLNLRG